MHEQLPIFLFPAFVLKYQGDELNTIIEHGIDLRARLEVISDLCQVDLIPFDPLENHFLEDELKNQLMTYILSCTYSDILQSKGLKPRALAGLSMGLYAALYSGRSLGFEEGAKIIYLVFNKILEFTKKGDYGMLSVIGLAEDDISDVIRRHNLQLEVVIRNGAHSFILSGYSQAVDDFQRLAAAEGALYTNTFPVSIPYHSSFIKPIASFMQQTIREIEINPLQSPLFSAVSGSYLHSSSQIRDEITRNLTHRIDWEMIMQKLNAEEGVVFYECGPGSSLGRILKFLEGSYALLKRSDWKHIQAV